MCESASNEEEVAHTFLSPVKSMLDAGAKVAFEPDRNSYECAGLEIFMTRADLVVMDPKNKALIVSDMRRNAVLTYYFPEIV